MGNRVSFALPVVNLWSVAEELFSCRSAQVEETDFESVRSLFVDGRVKYVLSAHCETFVTDPHPSFRSVFLTMSSSIPFILSSSALSIAVLVLPTYLVLKTLYRLYFHPLSGFPGPKLASITTLYGAYYDLPPHSSYVKKLVELHDIYGNSRSYSVGLELPLTTSSRSHCESLARLLAHSRFGRMASVRHHILLGHPKG